MLYVTTSKNWNPLSGELNPVPALPFIIFSTKTFSPTINCGVAKPLIGVFKVHVTIPELLLSTFVTLYPLAVSYTHLTLPTSDLV